jgi:hypothetical protein
MTRLAARIAILAALVSSPFPGLVSADDSVVAPGRRLIAADSSKQRIAMIAADGTTEWEHRIGPLHDLHVLPGGTILFQQSWTKLVEVDPRTDKTIWTYDAATNNDNAGRTVEVHAFQRLADGTTMIAESGPARIIEVDAAGKLTTEFNLKVLHPHPHRDTRLVRKLANGHYLACHEGDGAVREYDGDGAVVWEYDVPLFGKEPEPGHGIEAFGNQCFSALRLENGNTLIATGNGHGVIEVTPEKKIVWSVHQNDLPGVQLAWVTTLQFLPNGHIVLGNCHAGPENPQIVEITREKEVMWMFRDFQRFGDGLTNSIVLDSAPSAN